MPSYLFTLADVFEARANELLRLSGKLARVAADDAGRQVRVAASVPPMLILSTRKI